MGVRLALTAGLLAAMLWSRGDVLAVAGELFDDTRVHRIDLDVPADEWNTLQANFQEDDYYPAVLRWNGLAAHNVGIRSRGAGSRNGTKIGMRVDFGRFVDNQTFLGLRSIVLDNLAQDATGLKERVAMRFYERMGLVAPREAHTRLYVNGEYRGLYAVVESIDEDFTRRVFGDVGYLFEYEYDAEWLLTYPGPALDNYRRLFDPVTRKRAPPEQMYGPLDALLRAINEAPDDRFAADVGRFLDLPLFMRHVAAQNFLSQNDGVLGYAGVNNFYLYRPPDSPRSQFIFWDEDNAFLTPEFPIVQGHDRNVLMRRAMQVSTLRAVDFDALREAASIADAWLEQEIRRQRSLIEDALRADSLKPFTNKEVEAAEAALIEYARRRSEFVRRQLASLIS